MYTLLKAWLLLWITVFTSDLALLQGVAWVGMISNFAIQGDEFSEAVEKTFDGKNPCQLCHVVQTAQDEQDEEPASGVRELKHKTEMQHDWAHWPQMMGWQEDLSMPSSRVLSLHDQIALDIGTPPPQMFIS